MSLRGCRDLAPSENSRRVSVIANCHAGPLAQTLAFNSTDVEIDALGLDSWFGDTNAKAAEILGFLGPSGHLISYEIGAQFGALQSARFREQLGERFATCTNIRFDGLHPDCTYFGPFGARKPNFVSEYHSKIVIQSFSSGRSIADCIKLFAGKTFETLGYFEAFDEAAQQLRQREAACDIKFCEVFLALIRDEYSLLTINHPTAVVFHEMVRLFCGHVRIPFLGMDRWGCPNQLAQNVVWPIFDAIAEKHGLRYRTRQDFLEPSHGAYRQRARAVSLQDFVKSSYAYYATRLSPQDVFAFAKQLNEGGRFAAL